MNEHVLLIKPDGNVETLYTEQIDLRALGDLHVERASNVEFDDDEQGWRVLYPNNTIMLEEVFTTRQEALDAEVRHLQKQLAG